MIVILQTYIVYIIIFITLYYGIKKAINTHKIVHLVLALLPYSLFMGFRYGVGQDFFMYFNSYNEILQGDDYKRDFELGYSFLMNLFSLFYVPVSIFLGFLSFLQIFLVFKATDKEHRKIWKYLVLTFFFSCTWLSFNNGIRQELAFCIFCFSIRSIIERNFFKYCFLIILAALIHKSAYLLFLFYPLFFKRSWINNLKMQITFYFISLALMSNNFVNSLIEKFEFLIAIVGYSEYTEKDTYSDLLIRSEEKNFGIGSYILLLINLINILYSNKAKKFFNSQYFNIIYDMYYFGTLWSYVFRNSQLFSRINYYFYGFNFIVGAFILLYLSRKNRQIYYMVLTLYVLTFIGYMSSMHENTCLYIFNWQNDLFMLKQNMSD